LALLAIVSAIPAAASIYVVAATPELADITKQVGGDRVSVYSIAKPNQDYHMIEPRPSDVSRIARADMIVRIGMDLDMWMTALLNAASNGKVSSGGPGYVDASEGLHKLQVPHEQITGAAGDIHALGNPHYFYDPMNGKLIAWNVLRGLIRVSPGNKSTFESNYRRFSEEIDSRTAVWEKELRPYRGREVVVYHESAIYFMHRFGLSQFGELEPKPGIPPSPSHIESLIRRMKDSKVSAMVVESIYPSRFPQLVQRETGCGYATVPYSVGAMGTKNYFDLINGWVQGYKTALEK
jgi:ABC-type Zn uptake system ZnuABC Zn-binding protein ZnuA